MLVQGRIVATMQTLEKDPAKTAERLSELLAEMKKLMELNGENPFKTRAFDKAADTIAELGAKENWLERARAGTLTEIPGIGKGISQVLTEFLLEGGTSARDELAAKLPEGLLELTRVPGLGPKKARELIDSLGIKTLGELEYACRENRLLKLKGFGEKIQAKLLEGVQYLMQTQGQLRLVDAFPVAEAVMGVLSSSVHLSAVESKPAGERRISETGALRRRMETLAELDFLIELDAKRKDEDEEALRLKLMSEITERSSPALPVRLFFASAEDFGTELARTTAAEASWTETLKVVGGESKLARASDEETFFKGIDLPWIAPEMRETGEELALAREGGLEEIVGWDSLRGCFHNHTTRSDGTATLEEMILAAKARGMEYIGISDHSKSAFYAQGLTEEALREQEAEVRTLREKYPEIRIYWGIESDILADGSLDYDDSVLKRFDFVVASIHSRFQMDRATMTERVLQAVRNPRTTMLGHLTGRLLLGRKGYDLEMERVIRECAERGVAIEINAHPARLDIDWRWGPELRSSGCMVSVNPDAHETEGLDDLRYGICVARKALLPGRLVLNTRDARGIDDWLARK